MDQICQDLIITESESAYINEKAIEYNVPQATLNLMIEAGLLQAQIHKSLLRSPEYYDFVLACILCSVLCPSSNSQT